MLGPRVLMPAFAAIAALALAPAAAATVACVPAAGLTACAYVPTDGAIEAGARVGGHGVQADAVAEAGSGFFGNYVYVVPFVGLDGVVAVHGGIGLVDAGYDGTYENACVCGAVQSVVFVPVGVGVEDSDLDGQPDRVYMVPDLV